MPAGIAARIWYAIYNVVLHLGALVSLPVWLFKRYVAGRYRGQFRERMGILAPELIRPFEGRRALWVHAASAGETVSAVPLVRRLRAAFPEHPILFTVTSRYGKAMAERQLGETVQGIAFSPLDLPLFVGRFLRRFRPFLYVMVETDLWPNMVRMAKRRGATVVLASAYASPKWTWRLLRSFGRATLGHVDRILVQTEETAEVLRSRGAPPDRLEVTGNLKFEGAQEVLDASAAGALRTELGLSGADGVLVAGSTLAEDEDPVLDAVAAVREAGQDLRAVVAPRKIERVPPLEEGCRRRGLRCARRTAGPVEATHVLILDTMGELARTYNVASVAYVGGGLTADVGLHNIIEPAGCAVPVLFGPHHGKARSVAAAFLEAGAGIEVPTGDRLAAELRRLLEDASAREDVSDAERELLLRHRGTADRHVNRIRELVS